MRSLKVLISIQICLISIASSAVAENTSSCSDGSVILGFAGDILVHNDLYKSILNNRSFTPLLKKAEPLFNKADVMVANLEGPAAMGIDRSGQDRGDVGFSYDLNVYSGTNFSFNYHPQILSDLKNLGIDLISTANNHSLDRNWRGIDRTLEAAKNSILKTTGTRESYHPNQHFHEVVEIKGYRIAFLACTESTNGIPDTKAQVLKCYGKNPSVEDLIQELRERTDIDTVVVLPHWGVEYSSKPDRSQQNFARKYLDAGASAVVGSHPHVLQPWESYITKDGRQGMIVYSLGNFLAFQAGTAKKTGAVVYLRLNRNQANKIQVTHSYYTTTFRDGYTVYPISSKSSHEALKESARHFGTQNILNPDQKIPGCQNLGKEK